MQKPQCKLSEVIWEITGRCENACDYCGSKEGWNEEIDNEKIVDIAGKIADYLSDGDVNISGGDPLLVPQLTHQQVVQWLKEKNNKVKIIVNPKSFKDRKDLIGGDGILDLYDLIGISINSVEELNLIKDIEKYPFGKITIITNFNIFNVWEYDLIEEFVNKTNLTWQIQYTMSNEKAKTIYNNKSAKEFLFGKITKSFEKKTKLLLADNLNNGSCGAGKSSIGILSNGDVIPCLSMRSWCDLNKVFQGNILKESLEDIWENQFKEYRFGEFECCKDLCNSPYDYTPEVLKTLLGKPIDSPKDKFPPFIPYEPKYPPMIPMYPQQGQTMLYGVQTHPMKPFNPRNEENITAAYAVYTYNQEINPETFLTKGESNAPIT